MHACGSLSWSVALLCFPIQMPPLKSTRKRAEVKAWFAWETRLFFAAHHLGHEKGPSRDRKWEPRSEQGKGTSPSSLSLHVRRSVHPAFSFQVAGEREQKHLGMSRSSDRPTGTGHYSWAMESKLYPWKDRNILVYETLLNFFLCSNSLHWCPPKCPK